MDCYYHNYFSHNSPQNDNNDEHNDLSRDRYHPSYINKDPNVIKIEPAEKAYKNPRD